MLQPGKRWEQRYFVFENEVIKYSTSEDARDEFWTVIQIRDIVSFRVEVRMILRVVRCGAVRCGICFVDMC